MKRFVFLALSALLAFSAPRFARADAASEAWFKSAYDALQKGAASPGKAPAIYATLTLVSTEPAGALVGKTPDRTGVWYASGEVSRTNFPVVTVFEGKFPLFINSGLPGAPFPSGPATLGLTVDQSGQTTLHYQVDGRNRLGKGPQTIQMAPVASGSDKTTQMFSAATNFFGPKLIVLSLTRGEKDAPKAPPAPPKQATGARYRVTPVFVVTNSNDGVGDNTVEMQTEIQFHHAGKQVGFLINRTNQGQGGRAARDPFIVETRFDQTPTLNLKISGFVYDYDALGNDEMWRFDRSISLKGMANAKNGAMKIPSGTIISDGDATGYLEMKVEKIGDVF